MELQAFVSVFVAFFLFVYFIRRFKSPLQNLPLPPGPKRLPIIGNMFNRPTDLAWEAYDEWFKEFESDVVYWNVVGNPTVIVNTYEAAVELFEKRSGLYSGRPREPMLGELMGYNFTIGVMAYGEKWRSYRRLFHQGFNPNASKQFESIQLKAAHRLLLRMLDQPRSENIMEDFKHMVGSFIVDIVYGIKVLRDNDPYITLIDKAGRSIREAKIPGRFWVDLLPWLIYVPKWFPGAGFQRKAEEWAKVAREMSQKPFEVTKQSMNEGQFKPSFTSFTLETVRNNPGLYRDEKAVQDVAATAYVAGTDTTSYTLGTFALAMIQNPEIQKRAHAELDAVLDGQLPTFNDQNSLPYITAIVLEALRWKPIFPLGLAHCLVSDDTYKGYRLPSGSKVIPNAWSMLHDENIYPNPTVFSPDRYLKDGKLDPAMRDPQLIVFGFGRRICPGRYLAYTTLWITIASILATMEIKAAFDEEGKAIGPSGEYTSGGVHNPKPFACCTTVRSKQAESFIRNAVLHEE